MPFTTTLKWEFVAYHAFSKEKNINTSKTLCNDKLYFSLLCGSGYKTISRCLFGIG